MLKRTFVLGIGLGVILATIVVLLVQEEARPFTVPQMLLLLLTAILPGFGFALFFDPNSKRRKEEYLKIDFYSEEA